jgi:decaprenylphospho-beta-D-erythro-pentofuranosid-2-ulose 2-reductase
MRKVLMIGATSAIAQEVSRAYAEASGSLYLLGRNRERLEGVAKDLLVRGAAQVRFDTADLADRTRHEELLSRAWEAFGTFDAALIAYGVLPDQRACETDAAKTDEAITSNFTSVASWLTLLANRFEGQGSGTLAVISSVAGDRGRASNYVYGASKGALTIFLQGLRNRLHRRGVNVLTVKPGFVDTPMTAHLQKGFLFASPERVGRRIFNAVEKGKDVVYVPCFWRWIMLVIRHLPECLFKRLSL